MSSVVSVWIQWGNDTLEVRDVRRGQTLRVGEPPRPLVRCDGASATVWLKDGVRTLKPGDSVSLERDGAHYRLSCADVTGRESFAPRPPWRELLLAALALGLSTLGLWQGRVRAERFSEHFVGFAQLALPAAGDGATSIVRAEQAIASEPQSSALRTPGQLRCGRAEMGQRVAAAPGGRYGVVGPRDNADPHLSRPDAGPGVPTSPEGPLAALGMPRSAVGDDAPTAPWGRAERLGTDERSARGQMWGELLDEAWGDLGLGLAAQPGGVLKGIDVAPAATGGASSLRVLHTGLDVVGPRKASEVERALSASFEGFRRCAEQARVGEERRIELTFSVEQDGRVTRDARAHDALEACLDDRLAGVELAPGANAVAHVRYPLYFLPASSELVSARVAGRTPPAQCDCGG